MRKPKSISDETKGAILGAAWQLIVERGRTDIGMAEIAGAAGVSRQAVFYAFGGRPGLLLAMVRQKDRMSDHVERLGRLAATPDPDRETLAAYAGVWLDYLPIIYPVGILLDAASLTDEDAAAAWRDRMIDSLLGGFRRLAAAVHAKQPFDDDPLRLADALWAQVHPTMWRRLVAECGWSPEDFRKRQMEMCRGLIGL
ncbi:TetR/AcrR family transcriptional regulator [Oceanicola sp. 22II-s10i]|uniref:TetR/AcrR family transcriptional regulator n=1 Tax=Oceanicola sp. 22II-s10i TaxID=1317116 RepID=UPI0015957966|nr:TetR/AcrR family transcriptional regulator [Oceanicola sp. 22II-s10i]